MSINMRVLIGVGVIVLLAIIFWFWVGAKGFSNERVSKEASIQNNTEAPNDFSFDGYLNPILMVSPIHVERFQSRVVGYREVETVLGEEKITVLDGYQALYAFANNLPLYKLYVERTTPENFEKDKAVIARQFEFLAKQTQTSFRKTTDEDHEYYLVGDPTDRDSGTIEIASVFFPEDSIIVTIYFFNQGVDPSQRDFQTTEEYEEKIRDIFIRRLIVIAPEWKYLYPDGSPEWFKNMFPSLYPNSSIE